MPLQNIFLNLYRFYIFNRYVQELLGHSRPETTMIYAHVTQKDLHHIRSPLDNIVMGTHMADMSGSVDMEGDL